jgi:hypothetical protein
LASCLILLIVNLAKKRKGGKGMIQIIAEEAFDVVKEHISTLSQFEITDQWDDGWGTVYGSDLLTGC